jgi:YfiH family protein
MSDATQNFHADWLVPDWPAPAHVRAVFTTRAGGVSTAPFDALNLGDHVDDAPDAVRANRAVLREALAAEPVFLQQVHGNQVASLSDVKSGDTPTVADACITTQAGLACTIMVADCLPVLFTDRAGSAVAAAHAGWRGLAGQEGRGVLETTVQAMCAASSEGTAASLMAWLGPCIGPEAFEVGDEVRAAFVSLQPDAAPLFVGACTGQVAGRPGRAGAAKAARPGFQRRADSRQRQQPRLVYRQQPIKVLFVPARPCHRPHGCPADLATPQGGG